MKLKKLLVIVQAEAGPGTCCVTAELWCESHKTNNSIRISWRFASRIEQVTGIRSIDALAKFRAREAELRAMEGRAG